MQKSKIINISKISNINYKEKRYLLYYISKYYIKYRNNLNLGNKVSFGIEIEYENLNSKIVDEFTKNNLPSWKSAEDFTVLNGGELISDILYDTEYTWDLIKKACTFLKNKKANNLYGTSGGHIHIGNYVIPDINKLNLLLKCYYLYEDILLRFFYGDKINGRKSIKKYAKSTTSVIYNIIENNVSYKELFKHYSLSLMNFELNPINFCGNTIEFRAPNGTLEEIIWQNNINVISKMLIKIASDLDIELLNYKYENNKDVILRRNINGNIININKAFEFADMIFDNNLDKINFLRQYIKDNNVSFSDKLVLSKRFWK